MYNKILSFFCSFLLLFVFIPNAHSLELLNPNNTYYLSDNHQNIMDYPDSDSSSPFIQKYKHGLYEKMVDPGKALALSALYFGLGQMYSGDVNRGAWVMAGGTVLLAGILLIVVPRLSNRQESVQGLGNALAYGTIAVGYVWNIRDAYSTAEIVNKEINEKLLLSESLFKKLENVNLVSSNDTTSLNYRLIDF